MRTERAKAYRAVLRRQNAYLDGAVHPILLDDQHVLSIVNPMIAVERRKSYAGRGIVANSVNREVSVDRKACGL